MARRRRPEPPPPPEQPSSGPNIRDRLSRKCLGCGERVGYRPGAPNGHRYCEACDIKNWLHGAPKENQ